MNICLIVLLSALVTLGEANGMMHLTKILRNGGRHRQAPVRAEVPQGKPAPSVIRTLGGVLGKGFGGTAVLASASVLASEVMKAVDGGETAKPSFAIYESTGSLNAKNGTGIANLESDEVLMIFFGVVGGAFLVATMPLYCLYRKFRKAQVPNNWSSSAASSILP